MKITRIRLKTIYNKQSKFKTKNNNCYKLGFQIHKKFMRCIEGSTVKKFKIEYS